MLKFGDFWRFYGDEWRNFATRSDVLSVFFSDESAAEIIQVVLKM
jgi:hypothetical protein